MKQVILILFLGLSFSSFAQSPTSWTLKVDDYPPCTTSFTGKLSQFAPNQTIEFPVGESFKMYSEDGKVNGNLISGGIVTVYVPYTYECDCQWVPEDCGNCPQGDPTCQPTGGGGGGCQILSCQICTGFNEIQEYQTCAFTDLDFNQNQCSFGNYNGYNISFFKTVITPTTTNDGTNCAARLLTTSTISTTYNWEVTDNPSDPSRWVAISGKNSQNISITSADLPGLNTSGLLYARVKDPSCVLRVSDPSLSFQLFAPAPNFSLSSIQPTCNGGDNGSITIGLPTGGLTSYKVTLLYDGGEQVQYQEILSASSFPITIDKAKLLANNITTLSGIIPGTWSVLVRNNDTDTNKGDCGTTSVIVVPVTPKITPIVSTKTPVRCFGENNGTLTLSISEGAVGFNYKFDGSPSFTIPTSGNDRTPFFTDIAGGNHSVVVNDVNGCSSDSFPFVIDAPASLLTSSIQVIKNISCFDNNDGELSVNATGGQAGYSYSWSNGSTSQTVNNLSDIEYTVTVTDAYGCVKTKSETLTRPQKLDFDLKIAQPLSCSNSTDGILEVENIVNNQGVFTYLWSTTETASFISNLSHSISYSVTVTDNKNCSTQKSLSLVQPPGFSAAISTASDFNGKPISCNGEDDGELRAIVRDADNNITTGQHYEWFKNGTPFNSGTTLSEVDQLSEGNYKVVVTYNTICTTEQNFFLNDPDPVAPLINQTSNYNGLAIRCTNESNASLGASASGGSGGYTYVWNDAATTTGTTLTNLAAGTYVVTATDINGCVGTVSRTLVNPSPVSPAITATSNYNGFAIRCFGESNGTIQASATGGTGTVLGYSYVWNTGTSGNNLLALPAGTYSVTATDQNGCIGTSNITLVNPTATAVSVNVLSDFNGEAISCAGSSNGRLGATGSGGAGSFTYAWSTGFVGSVHAGLASGNYIVTATDANGCTSTSNKMLTDPTAVQAQIIETSDYNGYGVSCAGANNGYLKANASGGTGSLTYEWVSTSETSNRLSNVTSGSYTVIVRDSNGCTDSEVSTLTQPTALVMSFVNNKNISCFNGTDGELQVNASGGVANYEYSLDGITWKPSSTFTNLTAKAYTSRVRDNNNCITTLGTTLTQPAQLAINFNNIEPAYCSDPRGKATGIVTGGVGGYRYEWRNTEDELFDSDAIIENLSPGIYTLTSYDNNNCPVINSIGIVSADGPQVSLKEMIPPSCSYSSDGSATVEITQGSGPFTFAWPNGQTTAQSTNLAKGNFIVSVRDVNNCLTTSTVEVTAPGSLSINLIESEMPACFGDTNGRLKVSGAGGVGNYVFNWAASTGAELTGLGKGDYTVTLTDANACNTQQTFSLVQPEPLDVLMIAREQPLCFEGCDGIIEAAATGGNGSYQYTWSAGPTTARAEQFCAGNHLVTVVDAKGCSTNKTFSVSQPEALQLRLLANQAPDCHDGCNGKLEVDAIGGVGNYQYRWINGSNNALLDNSCAGEYEVIVTDSHSCAAQATYIINNPQQLQVDIGESKTLCVGQTFVLDAGSFWKEYLWRSNVGLTSESQSITINEPGQYWLEVKNTLGCIARDTFLLETSRDLLKASFLIPQEALVGDTIVVVDISWPIPESIVWSFPIEMKKLLDLGDVVYGQFEREGTYLVNLTTQLGECNDAISKSILVLKNEETEFNVALGYEDFVKKFELYPNPTNGNFNVAVELLEESGVTLSIWNPLTSTMMSKFSAEDHTIYQPVFNLSSLAPGTYVLRLDHKKGTKHIRFIVY